MYSLFFIFIKKRSEMKIDGIDKKIIISLLKDARTPILSIAREIGISGAAIHQRLRKLEKAKLISGYNLMLNPITLGFTTTAFVSVYLDASVAVTTIVKRLKEIPEILECHYTTGNFPIFIKVLCVDNEDLIQVLDLKIKPISGVSKLETFISLKEHINRKIKI